MNKGAVELYEERKKRIMDAVNLKEPDRVPWFPGFGTFAAKYYGITVREAFENMEKWQDLNEKLYLEFEPDLLLFLTSFDIKSAETVGSKYINWPGHNLPVTATYQFVEGEYMKAEEYDEVLANPGDFAFRKYLPRIFGNLEGLGYMPPLISILSYGGMFNAFSSPVVLEAFENIINGAKQNFQHLMATIGFLPRMEALGFPALLTFGAGLAPFDIISDYLRGMRGSTLDIYRRPEKLLALEDMLLKQLLPGALSFGKMMNKPLHFMATHRGSDEFMSVKQFENFWWPGFRTILLAMIDEGMTPFILWEGNFDQRLPLLAELPKGKTVALLDRTDIFKAKKVLGDRMCLAGNMPLSLLQTGTPAQVEAYTRKLIDEVGRDGGFIMAGNTELDYANPELVRVWADCTRKYGVY